MIRATWSAQDDPLEFERAELRAQDLGGKAKSGQQRSEVLAALVKRSQDVATWPLLWLGARCGVVLGEVEGREDIGC